jgi:hypothetical protein
MERPSVDVAKTARRGGTIAEGYKIIIDSLAGLG